MDLAVRWSHVIFHTLGYSIRAFLTDFGLENGNPFGLKKNCFTYLCPHNKCICQLALDSHCISHQTSSKLRSWLSVTMYRQIISILLVSEERQGVLINGWVLILLLLYLNIIARET